MRGEKVYEDNNVFATYHIFPVLPGCLLTHPLMSAR